MVQRTIIVLALICLYAFARREPVIREVEPEQPDISNGIMSLPIPITANGLTWFTTAATLWVNGTLGSDGSGTGTYQKPFATMQGAFNYFHTNTTLSPVNVNVFHGRYQNLTSGITMTENTTDSLRPLTFNTYGGEVHTTGSIKLTAAWQRPSDTSVTNRIQSGALNNVWVINLSSQGVTPYGYGGLRMTDNNTQQNEPSAMEVFINTVPQHLACWPNSKGPAYSVDSVLPIGAVGHVANSPGVYDPSFYYGAVFPTNRPATWRVNNSTFNNWSWNAYWARGTCALQYTGDNFPLDSIDRSKDSVYLGGNPQHGMFASTVTGVSQVNGKIIGLYYYNIIEELDTLGEFWLDSAKNNLYVYCDSATLFNASVEVSILNSAAILTMSNCAKLSFLGPFYFEYSRLQGLNFTKCDSVVFSGPGAVRNVGGIGIVMNSTSSSGNRFIYFNQYLFTGIGQGAADANGYGTAGTARNTLTPCGAVFKNCFFSNWARNYRTSLGLQLTGVADSVYRCSFVYDRGGAIDFQGNNHYIAYCLFDSVQYGFSDQGAIYTDRDPSSRGTKIVGCLFLNINNLSHNGEVSAIYLDDETSGDTCSGNFMYKCGSGGHGAYHLNGGGYNVITNTVLDSCAEGFSGIGLTPAQFNAFWIYGAGVAIVSPYVGLTAYNAQYSLFSPNFFVDTTIITNPLNNNVTNTLTVGTPYPIWAVSSGNWIIIDSATVVLMLKSNFGMLSVPAAAQSWSGYYPFNGDSVGVYDPTIKALGIINSTIFSK